MKILHIAPLWYPVTPNACGGIETFLSRLIARLETLGCRNTLIASGDSRTSGGLIPAVATNLCDQMKAGAAEEYEYYEQHQLMSAIERAAEFDVIHSHLGPPAYVLSAIPGAREKVLHTQHNPVYKDLQWFVSRHPDMWISTVSEFQARKLRQYGAARCKVIHNGIDVETFKFERGKSERLLFVGRISPGKGPDLAIRVARELDLPLTMAGPITDHQYFEKAIEPFLTERINYAGVVDHKQKNELFGGAGCVLMTSRWEEPFGLVSIESMACGTPVVALANGALPEIVKNGLTGYVTKDEESLPVLARRALDLDRAAIRKYACDNFDITVAAEQYCKLYGKMVRAYVGGRQRLQRAV